MLILGIDPGPLKSGVVLLKDSLLLDCPRVVRSAVVENPEVLKWANDEAHVVVLEQIESMGMAVGKEVFETVHWTGRFHQAFLAADMRVGRLTRRQVKLHLCGSMRAKDANIRQALIDKLGPRGTKRAPGGTYGVSSHAWSALALAVTWAELHEG